MTSSSFALRARKALHDSGVVRPAASIRELRTAARRRIPRPVFDFIDGGAEDERTLCANSSDFGRLTFRPNALVDVSVRDQRTTVLGEPVASPVLLGPCGLARLAHRDGELAAARAAAEFGTVFALSTASSISIERVAAAGPGPRWFQLYVWTDRDATRQLVERARRAEYQALCFTIDVPLSGQRERDLRNGMTIPPRPAPRTVLHWARHPRWVQQALLGDPITFGNFLGQAASNSAVSLGSLVNSQLNPSMCWDDLRWLRDLWDGPLVIKGIMSAADARRAVDLGADAVVVSNHGGRQLDGLPSTISVLPEVVAAVGVDADVYLDGGVRRGSDVVKALALGARACLVGRPWMYGLASGGQSGVSHALRILSAEIDRTLALIGVTCVADLTPDVLRNDSTR
jgi:isopentenyl diphosphate isomerase/L-lactate dehydrogenase-like FMN-dependent dehydrogenase